MHIFLTIDFAYLFCLRWNRLKEAMMHIFLTIDFAFDSQAYQSLSVILKLFRKEINQNENIPNTTDSKLNGTDRVLFCSK